MKKTFSIIPLFLMSMMVGSIASANQFLPEADQIKPQLETVVTNLGSSESGPVYKVIDHNPTLYNKQVVGNHTIEGWTKGDKAYTRIDGTLVKSSQINADLETVVTDLGSSESGPVYKVIDHNPTLYNKQVVGGHTIEGWTKGDKAYTRVDGPLVKSSQINADLETVVTNLGSSESGPVYKVIDHNPTLYNKQVVGSHTIEGWTKNGRVYTVVDGTVVKK